MSSAVYDASTSSNLPLFTKREAQNWLAFACATDEDLIEIERRKLCTQWHTDSFSEVEKLLCNLQTLGEGRPLYVPTRPPTAVSDELNWGPPDCFREYEDWLRRLVGMRSIGQVVAELKEDLDKIATLRAKRASAVIKLNIAIENDIIRERKPDYEPPFDRPGPWYRRKDLLKFQLSLTGVDSSTIRTGAAGRPTPRHVLEAEMTRRAQAGEMITKSCVKETEWLCKWLGDAHPELPSVEPKTLQNSLGALYRKLKSGEHPDIKTS